MKRGAALICALIIALTGAGIAEDYIYDRDWIEDAGVYIVYCSDGQGLMDADGNMLIEPTMQVLYGYSSNLFVAAQIIDDKYAYGYIDADGNIVIPFIYKYAEPFSDGYAAVDMNGKMGYIAADGAWAWGRKPTYADARSFSEGFAAVSDGEKYYYIGKDGERAWEDGEFDRAFEFSDGLARVEIEGKYRFINTEGEFAFDAKFKTASDFHNGIAYTYRNKKGAQFIDASGNVLLSFDEDIYEYDVYDEDTIIVSGDFYGRTDEGFKLVPAVTSDFDHSRYYPNQGELVPTLDEEATLSSIPDKSQPLPRVDGATALLPMYAAFVQAVYPDNVRYKEAWQDPDTLFTCSTTSEAYRRIADGETDIIFCAEPSENQIAYAAQNGVEFELTPIGYEAFVFIVNKENPIDNLSVEQIRGIYSGQITSWSQLNIDNLGDIIAYQRSEGSGSQTALEAMMEGLEIMDAPEANVAWDMGAILDRVEYRNYPNAIGYSFRFYVTGLTQADVKLLSLDGIAPTIENIASGVYPQTTTLYAVTRKGDSNPNLAAFLDWVQSEQAATLIEKSGYVPK